MRSSSSSSPEVDVTISGGAFDVTPTNAFVSSILLLCFVQIDDGDLSAMTPPFLL